GGELASSPCQCTHERRRTLAATENRWQPGVGRQVRAAIDRRNRQIELRAFWPSGERDAHGMKERASLQPGTRLHIICTRAEPIAIEPRRLRQHLCERTDHLLR